MRRFIAVLLLSSFAQAQMAQPTGNAEPERQKQLGQQQSSADTEKPSGIQRQLEMVSPAIVQGQNQAPSSAPGFSGAMEGPVSFVSSYTRYNQLRRGRDEEIVVLLCRPQYRGHDCPLNNLFSNQAELEPLTLQMTPLEGFTVRYREGKEFRNLQQGAAVHSGIGLKVFRLKVRADAHVPLGIYTLQGKLTFRKVRAGQLPQTQQIDVSIPLTVVEHSAQVVEDDWSLERHENHDLGTKILLAVTAPIWGPFFLAFLAIYEIDGGD